MKSTEILNYVDSAPSILREVFSSIVSSKSSATRVSAQKTAISVCKKINPLIVSDPVQFIDSADLDSVLALASDWSFQQTRTVRYKLAIQPFKKAWIKVLCYMYDLNSSVVVQLAEESDQGYLDIGDAVFLAGLYLALTE